MLGTYIPERVVERGSYYCTGIPLFTLLMWGHIKKPESKNRVNQGYLVVLKGRKID